MVGTVFQGDLDTGYRKFKAGTFYKTALKTFFAGRNILGGNTAAGDLVYKFKFFFSGFDKTCYTAELTGTTGLFFMGVVKRRFPGNGFSVSNPGLAYVNLGLVFTFHTFHVNF